MAMLYNQKTKIVKAIFLTILLCTFFKEGIVYASPKEQKSLGMRIANSTFIYLADPETQDFDKDSRGYLPAGTRFLIYNKVHKYRGSDWRLVLTEDGLWGYIKSSKRSVNYFNPELRQMFIDNDKVAIVQRADTVDLELSAAVLAKITLTRSESYKYIRHVDDGIVVKMTKLKMGQDVDVEVKIPYEKNMITIIDKNNPLSRENIKAFRIRSFNNIFGIRKPCGHQRIGTQGMAAGGKFDFNIWFASAKIGGDAEVVKSEVLSSNIGLVRTYYMRGKESGSYQISEILKCPDQGFSYHYVNPTSREIEFTIQFSEKGFSLDEETQQVLITKPKDYFRMVDILEKRKFKKFEIPFIISRLTKIIPE